jgi:AbrB family looped-hinge helix DNA binding protein
MVAQVPLTMGHRGRITLPAQIRAAAGLDEGDEVVAVAEGPGRVVLTTRAAIRAELDAALASSELPAADAAEDARAYREEDTAAADQHLDRAAAGAGDSDQESPGQALLRTVGLAS